MTNKIALILFLMIVAFLALDQIMGWGRTLAVMRTAYVFLDWIIFWR